MIVQCHVCWTLDQRAWVWLRLLRCVPELGKTGVRVTSIDSQCKVNIELFLISSKYFKSLYMPLKSVFCECQPAGLLDMTNLVERNEMQIFVVNIIQVGVASQL